MMLSCFVVELISDVLYWFKLFTVDLKMACKRGVKNAQVLQVLAKCIQKRTIVILMHRGYKSIYTLY